MIGAAKLKPVIGISACLLGRCVRYDGGHKRQAWLVKTLEQHADLLSVCPEMECGLGVPREPMGLTGGSVDPRLVVIRTGKDVTAQMRRWMLRRLKELEHDKICGFVFKSKSPSCGLARVRVFSWTCKPVRRGAGLFARAFRSRFPGTPVADEQALRDPKRWRAFIRRILALQRRQCAG